MSAIGFREVSRLLAAGGPGEWLAGVRWPLHRVMLDLEAEAAGRPHLGNFTDLRTEPDPEVGLAVAGLEAAILGLAETGVIERIPEGVLECWRVNSEMLVASRREVMRLPPADAELLYRAGRRWAALAETSLKKWRSEAAVMSSTVSSGTPNRRQVALSGF